MDRRSAVTRVPDKPGYADDLAEIKARSRAVELRESRDMAARLERLRNEGAWRGRLPSDPAVEIGSTVWASDMRDHNGDPRGGVVVRIADSTRDDPETGERFHERSYLMIDPYRLPDLHWSIYGEAQVNDVERLDQHRVWRCICALCLHAANKWPERRLNLSQTEEQRSHDLEAAWALYRALKDR